MRKQCPKNIPQFEQIINSLFGKPHSINSNIPFVPALWPLFFPQGVPSEWAFDGLLADGGTAWNNWSHVYSGRFRPNPVVIAHGYRSGRAWYDYTLVKPIRQGSTAASQPTKPIESCSKYANDLQVQHTKNVWILKFIIAETLIIFINNNRNSGRIFVTAFGGVGNERANTGLCSSSRRFVVVEMSRNLAEADSNFG